MGDSGNSNGKSGSTITPFDPIPPLTLMTPHIDERTLRALAQIHKEKNTNNKTEQNSNSGENILTKDSHETQKLKKLAALIPSNAILSQSKLILPIENARSVKNATRLAYGLNHIGFYDTSADSSNSNIDTFNESNDNYNDDPVKDRINLGFDVLKSLNQLSDMLDERKSSREAHKDRSHVKFHIGQVVRHKSHRWRAIIGGWTKEEVEVKVKAKNDDNEDNDGGSGSNSTSLTNKDYGTSTGMNSKEKIKDDDDGNVDATAAATTRTEVEYTIHLDEGDASQSRLRVMGSTTAKQHELEPVVDDDLKRLRNSLLGHYFDAFDPMTSAFLPGQVLQYEYPNDDENEDKVQEMEKALEYQMAKHANAKVVIQGVRQMAHNLLRVILDTSSCAKERKIPLIASIDAKLTKIITGEVDNDGDLLFSSPVGMNGNSNAGANAAHHQSSHKVAIRHLHALLNVELEINTALYQRRVAEKNKERINFPLGAVVKHKKYGFRGVVVTCDPYPKTDVSKWDGLQHIEGNVNDMPFYHLLADIDDTTREFGQERPFRYVCQENLEACSEKDNKNLNITLDDGWVQTDDMEYKAPDELLFSHAENMGDDDGTILTCMEALHNEFDKMMIQIRGGSNSDKSESSSEDEIPLSLGDMFKLLHNTDCLEDAFVAEEGIKEMWKAHSNSNTRWTLDEGTNHLLRGDKVKAMGIYNRIVEEEDPEYVEAWNKKATCHYMFGEMPLSIDAASKAAAINKDHFQAHAGLGLVYNDTNQYAKAIKFYRTSLSLNPWSPVSSRLNTCLDSLRRLELEEEIENMNKED